MSRRKPRRVLAHIMESPWAITEDGLRTILEVASRENRTIEAIEAEIGEPLENDSAISVRDGVATIPVVGPLMRYAGMFSRISGATSYAEIAADLTDALASPQVHSILLEIDSPGGEVTGVADLAKLIRAANETKPVTAHVEGLGASAAYWLASAAGEIITSDTGILGSIGVRTTMRDSAGAEEKRGVRYIDIVSSQSPAKIDDPKTEAGRARTQQLVDSLAALFIADVARLRGVSEEDVMARFGQGGVMVGADAVAAGLADSIGSYEAVHARLAERAHSATGTRRDNRSKEKRMSAKNEDTITVEDLATAESESYQKGVTDERDRVSAILAMQAVGHEKLRQAAIDSGISAGDLALRVIAAEAADRAKVVSDLAATEAGIDAKPAPTDGGPAAAADPKAKGREVAENYRKHNHPDRS